MQRDRMEALRLLRHAGLGAVEPDGCGGISRSLWIGDLAGDYHAALDGLSQHRLARLGVLIPAEGLARQKGIAEPLESDKSMPAPLGLGQRGAQLFHARVQIGGKHRFPSVVVFVVELMIGHCPARRADGARSSLAFAALEVNAHLVVLRRPRIRQGVAALAAAVSPHSSTGLVARRRQELQKPSPNRGRGKTPIRFRAFSNNLFCVGHVQVADINAALCSFFRFHFFLFRMPRFPPVVHSNRHRRPHCLEPEIVCALHGRRSSAAIALNSFHCVG